MDSFTVQLVNLTRRSNPSRPAPGQSFVQWRRLRGAVATLSAVLLGMVSAPAVSAQAPPPELFTPIANNRIADATPEQNSRLQRLRSRATTQSVSLIQINLNALKGNQLRIAIPGAATFDLSKTGGDLRGDRDFTWSGAAAEQKANATVVVRDGEVTGSITDPAGLYRIEPVGNTVYALVKVDSAKMPPEEPPSFRQKEQERGAVIPPNLDLRLGDNSTTQIDVLVAYTPAAKAAVSNIDSTIALAVAEANQSYVNSKINIRLNLVDTLPMTYTETGKTYDQILLDFAADSTVNQHRNQSGADLAAMIINQSDYCGLADAIMANPSTAFAIVHYDCATGYYSFAHELGHLMGARHNEQADSTPTPFAYGHGYQHLAAPLWRTVMAYACASPCTRLQYWSNPDVAYSGAVMGTAAVNNNARVLNETRQTVAAFRNPPVTVTQFPIWGVITSAGKQSGTPNWTSTYNTAQKWFEITIPGENYYYLADTAVATPSFGTGARGMCTSGSVGSKLLVECYDGSGNPVAPVSVSFATFKQPSQAGTYQGPLAYGVVAKSGAKQSGSANWTSTFNATDKQFEIAISGEKYHYLAYSTVVTPSFSTGAEGFCTSSSVNNKLLVKCYDCSGNVVAPVSFSFASFKGAGAYQKPLVFGVVSTTGKKESGTANFTSKYDPAAKQYSITITGQNYYYGSFATVVTPSFATGVKGFCTTGSVSNNLIVHCYSSAGAPLAPVSFGFATFK
jgi:hypothetical protein